MNMSQSQPNNPLHGFTLEKILVQLVDHFGWDDLGTEIDIRCFNYDPSIKSSLKFLRKTPWARAKVEALFLEMLRYQAQQDETEETGEAGDETAFTESTKELEAAESDPITEGPSETLEPNF